MKFQSNAIFNGTITANSVADAGTNTDKFLVLNSSGVVTYRTAAELYADLGIGSLPAGYTSTLKHAVKAGVALTKGQAVYVTGADGTNMIVGKASNASEATSSKTLGLIESSLSNNGIGNVITEGLLAGLDTTGATNAGDPVWLGVDGNLIYGLLNKPYAPANLVFIGIVTRINANNGEIFVKVQNGFELKELHDVDLVTTTPINGHLLGYNGTLWVNKTIAGWLGYTPADAARTLTINGTTYDLTANRSWTIDSTTASTRVIQKFTSTSNQTTFTITNGYTVGMVDVYVNGVKLDNATDFTASNGTTVVLTDALVSGQTVEVYKFGSQFIPNNALRVVIPFTATAGQTVFTVNYSVGLIDVFYNGSKLASNEFTATNGTSITLVTACQVNDIVEVIAYSYSVGAYSGIGGSGTANYVAKFATSSTIGDSVIYANSTSVSIGGTTMSSIFNLNGTDPLISFQNAGSTKWQVGLENTASNRFVWYDNTAAAYRMMITSGGMLGVGVGPNNWDTSTFRGLQISSGNAFLVGRTDGVTDQFQIGVNAWYDGNWKYNGNGAASRYYQNSGGHIFDSASSGTTGGTVTFTERMRITSGGYTKMSNDGTYFSSTGTYHEARNSVSDAILRLSNSNASPYGLSIFFTGADPNNVSNYILQGYHPNSATSLYTIWSNGTTSGRSDIRLKKNIVDATPKLDKLMQLRVVNYEWIESLNGTKEIGLIAQEVEEVFPNLIITEPIIKKREIEQKDGTVIEEEYQDGDSKSIKHSVLPFMLLKALQEANTKIDELSAKVTALDNTNISLQAEVEILKQK